LALGWTLIFQQALFVDPAKINIAFLVLAGGLVGTPTGAEAIARIRGVYTPSLPSSVPSLPSRSSSPSLPSGDEPV
jgi:hypothetical protein